MNISCPHEHNIEIINGNYGRFTITLCNTKGAQNLSVNCYLDEAMGYMRDSCNGRRDCQIQADVFQIKQDPCPGTERYLEAHYRCVPNQDLAAGMPPWMISADSQKKQKETWKSSNYCSNNNHFNYNHYNNYNNNNYNINNNYYHSYYNRNNKNNNIVCTNLARQISFKNNTKS